MPMYTSKQHMLDQYKIPTDSLQHPTETRYYYSYWSRWSGVQILSSLDLVSIRVPNPQWTGVDLLPLQPPTLSPYCSPLRPGGVKGHQQWPLRLLERGTRGGALWLNTDQGLITPVTQHQKFVDAPPISTFSIITNINIWFLVIICIFYYFTLFSYDFIFMTF